MLSLALYELKRMGLVSYCANVEQIRGTVYIKKLPQTEEEKREEERRQKAFAAWLESL